MALPPGVAEQTVLQFRAALARTGDHLRRGLRGHRGDVVYLEQVEGEAERLLSVLEQVRVYIAPDEARAAEEELGELLHGLHQARAGVDDTITRRCVPGHWQAASTRGGCPKFDINKSSLLAALRVVPVRTTLAKYLGISVRTLRRRMVELGVRASESPVYVVHAGLNGQEEVLHQPNYRRFPWDEGDVDARVGEALRQYPQWGRDMLLGHFRLQGMNVPQHMLRASLRRLAPHRRFGERAPLERRRYKVAGPNALWHMDAQLGNEAIQASQEPVMELTAAVGLVRYGVVFQGIIDGYSRLCVNIRASTNNRKDMFFDVFREGCKRYGTPSRMRGDHGLENLDVATWMIHKRGANRGSFIWGRQVLIWLDVGCELTEYRSVHNVRIERLWVDVTKDFGAKWKQYFIHMETWLGLDIQSDAHMWLLHYLFLEDINRDTEVWRRSWNFHRMRTPDGPTRSPSEMWLMGMVEHGCRGVGENAEWDRLVAIMRNRGPEQGEDLLWSLLVNMMVDDGSVREDGLWGGADGVGELLGVDWQALQDDDLMAHHAGSHPTGFTEFRVDEAVCPLDPAEKHVLDLHIHAFQAGRTAPDYYRRWERGLLAYNQIIQSRLEEIRRM